MAKAFNTAHRWDLEWQDATEVLALGEGVQVKVYYHDPASGHLDCLIKFPPGYVEPEHAHVAEHSVVVLEGVQIVRGEHMRPGDSVFGPSQVPHGPFEYPEGCVVFASFRGGPALHRYPGSPAGDI